MPEIGLPLVGRRAPGGERPGRWVITSGVGSADEDPPAVLIRRRRRRSGPSSADRSLNVELPVVKAAECADQPNDRRHPPGRRIESGGEPIGQRPRDVAGRTTADDVGQTSQVVTRRPKRRPDPEQGVGIDRGQADARSRSDVIARFTFLRRDPGQRGDRGRHRRLAARRHLRRRLRRVCHPDGRGRHVSVSLSMVTGTSATITLTRVSAVRLPMDSFAPRAAAGAAGFTGRARATTHGRPWAVGGGSPFGRIGRLTVLVRRA